MLHELLIQPFYNNFFHNNIIISILKHELTSPFVSFYTFSLIKTNTFFTLHKNINHLLENRTCECYFLENRLEAIK